MLENSGEIMKKLKNFLFFKKVFCKTVPVPKIFRLCELDKIWKKWYNIYNDIVKNSKG